MVVIVVAIARLVKKEGESDLMVKVAMMM